MILLDRHSQMRNGLEAVLQEEAVGVLGVLEDAEEDWALHLVLVLGEGIDHSFELVVYLAKGVN